MKDFLEIKTQDDFFRFLQVPKRHMTFLLYGQKTENSYKTFEISKRSGGVRVINTPHKNLKGVQKKLSRKLTEKSIEIWGSGNISHGFEEKKNILTNARVHRNKKLVLNVDLEDFFDSFHFGRVKGFFEKDRNFKVPEKVALIIAQLTCYEGVLPQGAPSSPVITNLICRIMDLRLLKLAMKYKLNYTRYADDLTFSTNNRKFIEEKEEFLNELQVEVERAGFKINNNKTRLQYKTSRQEVTGLVVNEKLNVSREYHKNTKAMAHSLYTKGAFHINGKVGTISQLEGRFAFVNQLDKYNNGQDNNKKAKYNHWRLNAREKVYQKFLFYKYFFGNPRPMIVTEGKTDVLYLKAALKSLYKDYPKLIEKKEEKYIFHILFLKRTNRLAYFLDFPKDGADAMKNLYKFFVGRDFPNYIKILSENPSDNTKVFKPIHPTIFLFDNECYTKKRPLYEFLSFYDGKEKEKNIEQIREKCHLKLMDNLFLLTNSLRGEKQESEIEDLFDEGILSYVIRGKSFIENDKKYKNEFSKYILKNYEKIDFENFRPMLDGLNEIVAEYASNFRED